MAITFPAAPTNGQIYTDTTSGQSWTWDGVKWKGANPDQIHWTRTGTALAPAVATDTIQGQLVPTNGALGSRNVIINGELKINQRVVTIAAAAAGSYGPDRWKKVDATNMTQIIEDVNFVPGAKYTLSWKGGTPQVLTAPGSGHWTLPNIPITATEVQLEMGEVATPYERRSYGQELVLCQRYYARLTANSAYGAFGSGRVAVPTSADVTVKYPATMRTSPTVSQSNTMINNVTTTSLGVTYAGSDSMLQLVSVAGGLGVGAGCIWAANNNSAAYIDLTAEL